MCSVGEDLSSDSHKNSSFCYSAHCFETVKAVVNNLDIPDDIYSVSFQSRLTKNWMNPFTDDVLKDLARQGKRRVLVVCPSFVVDCLETLYEIEIEYKELFVQAGGEQLTLVPALNSEDDWVQTLSHWIDGCN